VALLADNEHPQSELTQAHVRIVVHGASNRELV